MSRAPPTIREAVARAGPIVGPYAWLRFGPLDPDAPSYDECIEASEKYTDPLRARVAGALVWAVWHCPPLHREADRRWLED